jgi:hypothetical protein
MKGKNYSSPKVERRVRQINRRIEYFSTQYLMNWEEDATCRTCLIRIEERLWALEDALCLWEQRRNSLAFHQMPITP